MKKITCIQQYVIDNLIEDKILTSNSLLDAVSKVCSEEQFNNILSILIETPIPCTDIPKLERKEDSGNKTNLVRMRQPSSFVLRFMVLAICLFNHRFILNCTD